jgi:predicted lysophospholipase L1 biosynthesis ABC-type transport system permease subunit
MLLLFGIVIGLVLGYLFHPQIEKLLIKTVRHIKSKSAEADRSGPEDQG